MLKETPHSSKVLYSLSFASQLGFIIVVPIIGFLLLGRYIDGLLGTAPLLLILGIIVGVIVTAYEVYHMIDSLIVFNKKNHD